MLHDTMKERTDWSKLTPEQKDNYIKSKEFASNVITETQIETLLKIFAKKHFVFPTPSELKQMSIAMASDLIKTQLNNKNYRKEPYVYSELKDRFMNNPECYELLCYISEQHSYYGR